MTATRDPICPMCATQERGSPRLPQECKCGDYPGYTTVDPPEGEQRQPLPLPPGLSAVEDTARRCAEIVEQNPVSWHFDGRMLQVTGTQDVADLIRREFGLLPTIDGEMTDEHFDRDERR